MGLGACTRRGVCSEYLVRTQRSGAVRKPTAGLSGVIVHDWSVVAVFGGVVGRANASTFHGARPDDGEVGMRRLRSHEQEEEY